MDSSSGERGAAFFDLDRTVLSRSSALALAGAFRDRGHLPARRLVGAALTQLVFSRFGAREQTVRMLAERGMAVLAGIPVVDVEEIVTEAMEPALKPLVYRGALDLAELHAARGEPTYIVSAALQQVVDAIAAELGFTAALGSTCETVEGVFTGRLERGLYGDEKARAVGELAAREEIDLARSVAYSDSHTDLAFLEAVGEPVVVNPDRELLAIANERGWEVLRFDEHAFGAPRPARRSIPVAGGLAALLLALGAAALVVIARRRHDG